MRVRRRALACLAVVVLVASLAACSADDPVKRQALPTATVVPTERAQVPDGWTVRQGAGFTVAIPPDWQTRPPDQRAAKDAALEVGIPFTGQPSPPPRLIVFVEQQQVGPLSVREPLLRAQIANGLPDATLGASRHVQVAGAVDALQFDVSYTTKAGTSVLGTALEATPMQQRELIVETPGLPKYGLRYTAPADQFSEDVWRGIQQSLTVGLAGRATGTTTGADA
jgi:hypothetical protein